MNSVKKPEINNILKFIKEVAKYFMDFLETNFHKRRNPKRSVQLRNSSNLLIGLKLNKYPSFNTFIWKVINRAFDKTVSTPIEKGTYRTSIPNNLLDLVKLLTEKITSKQISKLLEQISEEVEKSAVLYKKEYDQALISAIETASKIFKREIVLPFVMNIEKPLENLNLGDENDIYLMEEELTSVLVVQFENKLAEILKLLLSETKVEVFKELKNIVEVGNIKSTIISFFENFQVGDLFTEITEMERNRTILDKQEFYLYFCDITFSNTKYPIFYIPVSFSRLEKQLVIEYDSQVYVNKKALEYIVQEYNLEKETKGSLQKVTERIIYLAQHQNDFKKYLNEIIDEITNFFGLDKKIDVEKSDHQVSKSFLVRISNTCYLTLFDKSDEALVNDYEEILRLLAAGNSDLAEAFNKLIEDFIFNNPQPINPIVEEEWDDTEIADRLVFNSPIPLNGEQRQILSAIGKNDCKYITVEGPPGTGDLPPFFDPNLS